MKVIICGSISAAEEILRVKLQLERMGHTVEIPEGVKREELRNRVLHLQGQEEKAEDKIKYNLIRSYYEKMKNYEVVLIVNSEKNGVKGYIGGNTLIEMAFGHVLGKKLFCLYELPNMQYSSEIIAMQPIILRGDLSLII